MKEGSYLEIRPGMAVVGRGEEEVGAVEEVLEDAGSGIFVGLVVKAGRLFGRSLFVPGEKVERLHANVVTVDAAAGDLGPYVRPDKARTSAEVAE